MAAMTHPRTRSTFYWAMRLMPRERRAAMFAIYDLARALDDIADGPEPRETKHAALAEWRAELGRTYEGRPARPLALALAPAIERFGLPREELEQLMRGMEMDIDGPLVAPSRATLDLYCRRVAGSIGLLSLPVFGADGGPEREVALYLGRALQLTNILRDLGGDAASGRLYVPVEYLGLANVDTRDPVAVVNHPRIGEAARLLANDAQRAFAAAERHMGASKHRRALWPAAAMLGAYRALLARLETSGFSPARAGTPSRLYALGAALRAAIAARL
jgi:phytoene synthase